MAGKLVSAVMWREEGDRWLCSLLHLENGCSRIVLEPGFNLSFRVLEGRFCVGYTELSSKVKDGDSLNSWKELRPCPTGAEIGRGIRCVDCLSSDIMRPCLRCDGTNCLAHPDLGRVCKESTAYVYLATFGGDRIKAGVSQGGRVLKRWIEQGADAACRVLVGNGREVREFEKRVQNELGALNHVRAGLKMNPVRRQTDVEAAIELLEDYKWRVYDLLPKENHFNEEPQLILPHYRLPEFDRRPLKLRVREGLQASGVVLGVKGPILFLEMGGLPYSLNLYKLLGRRIETEEVVPMKSQTGLDHFLDEDPTH